MKRPVCVSVATLLVLTFIAFLAQKAQANTSVEVSGSGEGSHASVNINQHINSSSTSGSSNTRSRTDIRIESNGQVKEYHSDQPGNVSIQSDDGAAKVEIKNNVTQPSTVTPQKPQIDSSVKIHQEVKRMRFDLKEFLKKEFESLRNFLSFRFFSK